MIDNTLLISIEKSVLSTFLFEHFLIEEYLGLLKPEDFYLIAHQKIYQVMIDLYQDDLPIDESFIRKRLTQKEVSDKVIIEVLSANQTSTLSAYIDEIIENSKKRSLLKLSVDIKKNLSNSNVNYDDIANNIIKNIENIQESTSNTLTSSKLIEEFKAKMILAAENGNNIIGQKTGLKALDNKLGACEDGDLIVIAARPSMGKTAIISTIVSKIIEDNSGVLIESLEMPAIKIIQRLVAYKSGESLSDIKKGLVKNIDLYNESLKFYSNDSLLVIHDKSYPTVTQLQSRIKSTLRKNPLIKNIFVDHTGKILLDGKTREDIEIGYITSMLKKIARDYNIRVFLLQQLNRSVEARENKRPMLSDLKNSGNIEEDADIVLGLYRDSYYKEKKEREASDIYSRKSKIKEVESAEIIILKNRDGEIGKVDVAFEARCARFIDEPDDLFQKVYL